MACTRTLKNGTAPAVVHEGCHDPKRGWLSLAIYVKRLSETAASTVTPAGAGVWEEEQLPESGPPFVASIGQKQCLCRSGSESCDGADLMEILRFSCYMRHDTTAFHAPSTMTLAT